MREPHVRWCESWGRAISPGYSITVLIAAFSWIGKNQGALGCVEFAPGSRRKPEIAQGQ